MPTDREREYYRDGMADGIAFAEGRYVNGSLPRGSRSIPTSKPKTSIGKRKLSAWNKFVKANSKKPRFRFASGKLKLKKMAIAFRKTPAGKKKRR